MKTTIIAAAILLAASPAFASTSLLPRLAEADDAVKNVAPDFRCDPGRPCQQVRGVPDGKGGGYETFDVADGRHIRCFWSTNAYGLCQNNSGLLFGFTSMSDNQIAALPSDDPRCKDWGSVDTVEYLSCEAAQPQKLGNGS